MLFALLMVVASSAAHALGNVKVPDFNHAKKAANQIHKDHPATLYCGCHYQGNKIDLASCGYKVRSNPRRATRLEWEHVVPAEAFGNSFKEWREGDPELCVKGSGKKFKGRKCAEKNPEFARMEADLYNLWPEVGELNGLRNNYSMAQLPADAPSFGGCRAKVEDRKFEPMDMAKGIVARTYLYMNQAYPGRGVISGKNEKLFAAWDKMFPVTHWECERAQRIERVQGNSNPVLVERCKTVSGS
jgi:deoxyribonuclease-1